MALARTLSKARQLAKKKVSTMGALAFKKTFPTLLSLTDKKPTKVKKNGN